MIRKALLITTLTIWSTALGGCYLYMEDDSNNNGYNYCDDTGCYYCDDWGCYPDGSGNGGTGQPGWTCSNNYECAAGCFCNSDGFCEEGGFCSYNTDCADGYECDDRSSCVPEGSSNGCQADTDCPNGSYCEEATGICVGSWTCDNSAPDADASCGMGFECDDRNTCVPEPCTSDDMCQEGCYCDEDAGECIESGTCDALGNCFGDMVCDESRNTCVPPGENPVTCQGAIDASCDAAAPVCPVGSTPEIQSGCYTGGCMLKTDCPDGAPFECSDLNDDENACFGNAACNPVYKGVNCTDPGGNQCTSGDANCTCESFTYDYCEEA
jgi:hypothetical protein